MFSSLFWLRFSRLIKSFADALTEKVLRGDELTKREARQVGDIRTNPAAGLIRDELEAREISAAKAARDMSIPRSRLSDIFNGRKGVSADTRCVSSVTLAFPPVF